MKINPGTYVILTYNINIGDWNNGYYDYSALQGELFKVTGIERSKTIPPTRQLTSECQVQRLKDNELYCVPTGILYGSFSTTTPLELAKFRVKNEI